MPDAAPFQLLNGDLFTFEVLHHQVVIGFCDELNHLIMILLRLFEHICRDILITNVLAKVVIINLCTHRHQINNTDKLALCADRQLNRYRNALQAILHHLDNVIEVCAHDIHLIDERHTRNLIIVCLMPYSFRLRLNAALCAEYADRAIQYTQGTLNLYCEVNVARGVNDIDTVALPMASGSSRGNGNASLLLLCHPVHDGCAFMRLTDFMRTSGIIQDTLGSRRLTSVDMRHDTDISCVFQCKLSGHVNLLS